MLESKVLTTRLPGQSLYSIFCSILQVLFFFSKYFILLLLLFWLCLTACGILVPLPRIKPLPPALEACLLNYWTARDIPAILKFNLLKKKKINESSGSRGRWREILNPQTHWLYSYIWKNFLCKKSPKNWWKDLVTSGSERGNTIKQVRRLRDHLAINLRSRGGN